MIQFSDSLRPPEQVIYREIAGEAVLLNLDTEAYHGLDEVGVRMWSLLTSSDSVQEAYDALLAEYEVEPETLRADLATFIDSLVERKLLEVA
jgi:hypothetical protein